MFWQVSEIHNDVVKTPVTFVHDIFVLFVKQAFNKYLSLILQDKFYIFRKIVL